MTALSERLRLLVTRAGTARELARRAGLGETHVSLAIKRAEEKESGAKQRGEVGLSTAAALARAGEVRLEWLATGEEPMERGEASQATSPVDRARLAAKALEYAPAAIEAGTATVSDSETARAIFARIVRAEGDAMAPANDAASTRRAGTASSEAKVIGTPKKVIEAGKLSPDDALAALDAEEKPNER